MSIEAPFQLSIFPGKIESVLVEALESKAQLDIKGTVEQMIKDPSEISYSEF